MIVDDCRHFINRFLFPVCGVFPGIDLFNTALDVKGRTGYSYYDSLIIASAIHADCKILYTEDMQDGREILGLRIVDPFQP